MARASPRIGTARDATPCREIAADFGVSRPTIYRHLAKTAE
jgi:transposase